MIIGMNRSAAKTRMAPKGFRMLPVALLAISCDVLRPPVSLDPVGPPPVTGLCKTPVAEAYETALAQARSGECHGTWISIGTCGAYRYLTQTNGFEGCTAYYAPDDGQLIAVEQFTDTGESNFIFGHTVCDLFVETERVSCPGASQEP